MTEHIVLLGDSIFDNAAYVRGGPDVVQQLRELSPSGWKATLAAVDGATTTGVPAQLARIPKDATKLVLSVGGNDALGRAGVIEQRASSVADALRLLARVSEEFETSYSRLLDQISSLAIPTAICTIYYPAFEDPTYQLLTSTALTHFNDVIIRQAHGRGLPLLDLRLICGEKADYANPIEPSTQGGAKISRAILRLVQEHNFAKARTSVFL